MNVICKTTSELSREEIEEINSLFEEVFEVKRTPELFLSNYSHTPFGVSYHSILYNDEGNIVGFHTCMPFRYLDDNTEFKVGLGIDSMVRKEYRDYFSFHDMIKGCEKRLKKEGFALRIGFPNDNAYPVLKKGLKYKDIGKLKTYCLIKNIGGYKRSLSFLNWASTAFTNLQLMLSRLSSSSQVYEFRYRKHRDSFNAIRYKWFFGDYNLVKKPGIEYAYRVKLHEGVRTAFILDVHPMSRKNFESAVREVYKAEKKNIDMILYVGNLPFIPISLLTIPHKYEPKHFNFTCNVLDKGRFDSEILKIENWDVNLSNYDLL